MRSIVAIAAAAAAAATGLTACGGSGSSAPARPSCVDRVAQRGTATKSARVQTMAREVARLRQLRFKRVLTPEYVTPAEMVRRYRKELDDGATDRIELAERALLALGALKPGTDLKDLARNELSDDVDGYYDQESHKLVVLRETKKGLSSDERLTLAHELEHALVDQAIGMPDEPAEEPPPTERRNDGLAAAESALIEGDATLLEYAYARADVSKDVADYLQEPSQPGWSGLPYIIEASEGFPYTEGEAFVCHLYRRGGWRAVDQAYKHPPTTTAQILFPDRFIRGEGFVGPPEASSPGRGWKQLDYFTLGADDLLALFRAPGDQLSHGLSQPRLRAAAWAGGEAKVWGRGERTVVTLSLLQRIHAQHISLCESMRLWAEAAGKPARAISCSGRVVRATLHG